MITGSVGSRVFSPGRVSAWLLVLCLALTIPASPLSAAETVPTKLVTPNGITVLVLEQHFLPIVEVHAMVKSGSAQDPPEKAYTLSLHDLFD